MLPKVVAAVSALLLILLIATASAVTQKSTVTWPVVAPTRVAAQHPDYTATGWTVSSPFGWRPDPAHPGQWELHQGTDMAGPMFCLGCAVPPLADIAVMHVGWDQEWSADPLHTGAGVVVDMDLQHPEESGTVRVRYGHLQPYHVYVRTRSCTQTVDCPGYHADSEGSVMVTRCMSLALPGRQCATQRTATRGNAVPDHLGRSPSVAPVTPGTRRANGRRPPGRAEGADAR